MRQKRVVGTDTRKRYLIGKVAGMLGLLLLCFGVVGIAGAAPLATQTVRDEFNTVAYSNNNGTMNWATDWVEVGDDNAANNGDVRIISDLSSNRLRLGRNDNSISRQANLSGYVSAVLSFDYRREALDDSSDFVMIQVSSNGGTAWTELDRYDGSATDSAYRTVRFDISAYIASNTAIRFLTSSGLGSSDYVYFDNVQIQVSDTATVLGEVCYVVADAGGRNGGDDLLTRVDKATGTEIQIGSGTGTSNIEAAAYQPGTTTLYAANEVSSSEGRFGTISTSTGVFTAMPNPIGSGSGSLGTLTFNDVDSLGFDPFTGILYGVLRRGGSPNPDDVLFQIDRTTGQRVANAFGAGVDYVVLPSGSNANFKDIDDIAISSYDGTMYAVANANGSGDELVTINKATGALTSIGVMGVNDMEGMAFDVLGNLFGTTGNNGSASTNNSLYDINKTTGVASNQRLLSAGSDYESVDCLTAGVNTITGTVYNDANGDQQINNGETGTAGITVRLYRDVNNDGMVDAGDTLLGTVESAGDGTFTYAVGGIAAVGNFVMDVDSADLPANHTLTTDNLEVASFADTGNTDANNNYGHREIPTSVLLDSFEAFPESDHILLRWETVSELNNLGFNLYRNVRDDEPGEQLNPELIASQGPGSSQGFLYEWQDVTVEPYVVYYYWLEDVDFNGTTTLHGPISAALSMPPTAVTLGSLAASAPDPRTPALALGLLTLLAAGLLTRWHRRR